MKICIISEGAYPYIIGGVSSWIQQLITNMPEHEFIIIAINPESKVKGKYKYDLPPNLIIIHDMFLDEILNVKGKWNKNIKLLPNEIETLKKLLIGNKIDWKIIFDIFKRKEIKRVSAKDLLLSESFYKIIKQAYNEKHSSIPFAQTYWTLQSMYLLLFSLLYYDYPEADIYHSVSTGYAGFVGAYASYINNKKLILTEHGIYTREREEEIIQADWVVGYVKNMWIDYFYNLSDCAYINASKVISLFDKNKEIQIEIGCPENKIDVIHNGINIRNFEEIAKIQELKVNSDNISVGAIVRVVPIKDIKTMLQAFSLVNEKHSNIVFYIMGPYDEDPSYYKECIKYKDSLRLDNVFFTGMVNIKEYLSSMDILVLTSISEGQPLSILEGMACRLPFVTTNVGDCGSLVNGENDDFGANGFVAPIMDYIKISEGISKLANDYLLRKKFGNSGYNRVINNYSFDKFISEYKMVYNSILGG